MIHLELLLNKLSFSLYPKLG